MNTGTVAENRATYFCFFVLAISFYAQLSMAGIFDGLTILKNMGW